MRKPEARVRSRESGAADRLEVDGLGHVRAGGATAICKERVIGTLGVSRRRAVWIRDCEQGLLVIGRADRHPDWTRFVIFFLGGGISWVGWEKPPNPPDGLDFSFLVFFFLSVFHVGWPPAGEREKVAAVTHQPEKCV
ncbi:hypothetical protein AALO_G00190440 [Alosa alosa]|uniref:Uncharacterized protein n=1 Tax=Alosa alosa TaxID=278164 RepID=A0AAV6G9P3_9TELE|nr:hypothetical protein AALO_G00190440 [Alosa alosa]